MSAGDCTIAAYVLSRRAQADFAYYRAMAATHRIDAATHRAQAEASRPTRDPNELLLAADTADTTAARWEALADELAALEQLDADPGQETLL